MVTVRVSTVVAAPVEVVWDDLRQIAGHSEWMSDAVRIRFLSEATEGLGVRFECDTRIGPFGLTDRMEVTEWREPDLMGISHTGLVTGVGRFRLTGCVDHPGEARTRIEWVETLRFPWWMGGLFGAAMAKPVLRAVWKRNLVRFADRF